jgi:tRNA(Glu) U13 pseudouridine synthase TruD
MVNINFFFKHGKGKGEGGVKGNDFFVLLREAILIFQLTSNKYPHLINTI